MAGKIVESDSYTHNQPTPATEWVVNHNLAQDVVGVDVWVDVSGETQKVIPLTVEIINNNSCKVVFSTARSGRAVVV